MKIDRKAVGQRLRRIREAEGLNEAEMSRRLGTDRTNYGRWEDGERRISMNGLIALCTVTDATADYVLFGSLAGMSFDLRDRLRALQDLTSDSAD